MSRQMKSMPARRRRSCMLLLTLGCAVSALTSGCVSSTSVEHGAEDALWSVERHLGPNPAPLDPTLVPAWMGAFAGDVVGEAVYALTKYDGSDPKAVDPAPFWYLPDESQGSVSLGDTSNGRAVALARLEGVGESWRILPRQRGRDLGYGTDELIALIQESAQAVAQEFPGATLQVGNIGRAHGGDIPYSVSHNSGRDADLAFFALDGDGAPIDTPDMLSFTDEGRSIEYDGFYRFDVSRNWSVVRALIESEAADLQYLFISNGLRSMLLSHARSVGAAASTIARAEALLRQPGVDNPHNDHLHLRVYCSAEDIQAGCKDTGVMHAWAPARRVRVHDGVARALDFLAHDDASVRIAALRRIELLGVRAAFPATLALLEDEALEGRQAAMEIALGLNPNGAAPYLLAQAKREDDPALLASQLKLVAALQDEESLALLASLIRREDQDPRAHLVVEREKGETIRDLALNLAAELESLALVPALVDALYDEEASVRVRAAEALSLITNHRPTGLAVFMQSAVSEDLEGARAFWADQLQALMEEAIPYPQILLRGFESAGYVLAGTPRETAAVLASACGDERVWLSVNAQRLLMRMTGNTAPSLSWHPEDAQEYWTRWTERNRSRIAALR